VSIETVSGAAGRLGQRPVFVGTRPPFAIARVQHALIDQEAEQHRLTIATPQLVLWPGLLGLADRP
jgi:hypothetical protein